MALVVGQQIFNEASKSVESLNDAAVEEEGEKENQDGKQQGTR